MKKLFYRLITLLQIQRGLLFSYGWLRSWWQNQPHGLIVSIPVATAFDPEQQHPTFESLENYPYR